MKEYNPKIETSRIVLPDCTGCLVEGRPAVEVGDKLKGGEFGKIKNYTISHIDFRERHNHYTFYTNYTPRKL